jgi:drug/metabolite transporter (DMT)-like permease
LASRLGVFSFLTPLFGILLGAWLLSEPIEASFLMGAVPVLIGIVLVSGGAWVTQALKGLAN